MIIEKIRKKLKDIWNKPDIYLNDINEHSDNKNIENAKKEIREMIFPILFAITSFIIFYIIMEIEQITEKNGSGYAFFGYIIIYLIWAFVIVHIRNQNKPHSRHTLRENYPQQHE